MPQTPLDQETVDRDVQIFTQFTGQVNSRLIVIHLPLPSSPFPPPSSLLLLHILLTSPLQFDTAVKNLAKMAADQTTKCQNHYKREFQMIGKSFTQLGQAMEGDGGDLSF